MIEKKYKQEPIAFFINNRGIKLTAYDEKQAQNLRDLGYKKIDGDQDTTSPVEPKYESEKIS